MKNLPVVLVVDDDNLQLLLMKELFKRAGVPVECVTSGESALEEIQVNSYRCMITDLNMPRMNGFELARHARQLAPQMRITLCTSEQSPQLNALAAEAGIDAVFIKSINYSRMLAAVLEDLGMSSEPTASSTSRHGNWGGGTALIDDAPKQKLDADTILPPGIPQRLEAADLRLQLGAFSGTHPQPI